MIKVEEELISTLHQSVQSILNLFKLIKVSPPSLKAKSVVEYAKLIEEMLAEFYKVVPKMCVPMKLFKSMEKENAEISQLAENYMKEHRNSLIQMKVLEDKLKESHERQKALVEDKNQMIKNSQHYKRKAQILKKKGEEGVRNVLEISSQRDSKSHRHSLPSLDRMDKKQKIAMLYLMGPINQNDRLVNHLMHKR